MQTLLKIVDALSTWCARLAIVSAALMTIAMSYEVAARYLFSRPTVWAFDISYMSNGAVFLLGIAWVLKENAHIRIDVIKNRLPPRLDAWIQSFVYILLLSPIFGFLTYAAAKTTWRAWIRNEVETVSPWAPLMWPFYTLILIGLAAMTLQLLAEGIRLLASVPTDEAST